MKRTLYLLSLLTLAACSNDENVAPEVDDNRTEIAFSSNLSTEASAQPMTRALTEDGFTAETRIVMRIKSEDGSTTPTETKYTRTVATAAAKGTDSKSSVSFSSGNKRYWDDAHGRNSKLSVYAVAVENKSNETLLAATVLSEGATTKGNNWTDAPSDESVSWTLNTSQTSSTIADENLVYSNNIQNSGSDARLSFKENGSTGHGTFDKGELKFNHALTRITVKLQEGDGFSSFGTVVGVVKDAPYTGKLNLSNGSWSSVASQDITMASTSEANTYQAQMLPGLQLQDGSTNNILEFTIDGNVYYVTSDMLFEKLNGVTSSSSSATALDSENKLKPGMNYAINVTVKKTGIQVSAKVVAWDEVEITETLSNSYIHLSFYDSNGTACDKDKIKLYYCTQEISNPTSSSANPDNLFDWSKPYTGPATLLDAGLNTYKAENWYFDSNMTFYHFRTTTEALKASDNKVFEIKSGFSDSGTTALDPHWGAPIKFSNEANYKPKYNPLSTGTSKPGFGEYIHSAIGSTADVIQITEFHMLSNVIIKLATPNDDSRVNLTDATVKLLSLYNQGTVDMGSGFITETGNIDDNHELLYQFAVDKLYYFSPIVPQALKRSDNKTVGIEITTIDGNVYKKEDISGLIAKTVSSNAANHTQNNAVDRWYPGTQYTYTFTLKKTGIETVTCTVTNWDEVTVDGGDITIQ